MRTPVILRVFKGNQLIEVKQFDQEQIVIGHDAEVQLDLDHESISPIHCLIEKREQIFYICDLGSKTGTFRNGETILDEPLNSGDEIQIGPFKIAFFVGVPKPRTSPNISLASGAQQSTPTPSLAAIGSAPVATTPAQPQRGTTSPPSSLPGQTSSSGQSAIQDQEKPANKISIPKEIPKDVSRENKKEVYKEPLKDILSENSSDETRYEVKDIPVAKPKGSTKPQLKIEAPNQQHDRASLKGKKTFSPPNQIEDLKKFIRPTKGGTLEVLVSWKDRIIGSYHFKKSMVIKSQDLNLPLGTLPSTQPIIELKNGARVVVSADMECEIVGQNKRWTLKEAITENKATYGTTAALVKLEQSEVIFVTIGSSGLQLIIRYVPVTPIVPLMPPLLMSSSEITGLVISLVLVAILGFTISAITPPPAPTPQDDITRIAKVVFENPPPTHPKAEVKPLPPPPPPPPEVKPPPPPPPDKAKAADQMKEAQKKGKTPDKDKKAAVAQKAAEVAPIPDSKNKPKKFTSLKQGGAVKIGKEAGANAQSSAKDVTKMGLFSAFSGGGTRKKIDEAYSGAGELLGQAEKSNGGSGMGENRAGDDLGSKFKDTGAGGKGVATQGISGVGTKGRSTGMSAYGSTEGLGDKTNVNIQSGGSEENFVGTIDKEAVRRVVLNNLNQVRGCFVRELNKLDLAGRRDLEGKVIVSWDIAAKGIPKNVRVKSSTLNNRNVENCIRERLASWIFPEPPVGMTAEVSYPFYLRPGN